MCGCAGEVTESAACIVCCLQRKSSFLTVTLKYRLRTMRGSGELVLAPLHSSWTSTALCQLVRQNKHNKRSLSRLLSTFNLGCGVSGESRDGVFLHDEAYITSYLFQAADAGRQVVRILSDDSDIFVQLVYWTRRYDLQVRFADGEVRWC